MRAEEQHIKVIELRRHTDNDGDVLTPAGVEAAMELGRRLESEYAVMVSSGAQRATQTIGCILAGFAGEVPGGVVVEPGIRSEREDDWRAAYRKAGSGDLASLREADPDLVTSDSEALADGVRRILDRLEDGQRALAVGHSPTNEAAVYGLCGELVEPLSKGEGLLLQVDGEQVTVERLD